MWVLLQFISGSIQKNPVSLLRMYMLSTFMMLLIFQLQTDLFTINVKHNFLLDTNSYHLNFLNNWFCFIHIAQ